MNVSRGTWAATIRLAAMLSIAAAVLTLALASLGDVSAVAIVSVVGIVGFVSSWVVAGRTSEPEQLPHRISVVPLHHHVG